MECIETKRIVISALYDCGDKRVKGNVYSKVEEKEMVLVGTAVEERPGVGKLTILPAYADKAYITEDFEQLHQKFVEYADFWRKREREGHGVC